MMQKLLRWLLLKPILWIVEKFTSLPDRDIIFSALTKLKEKIETEGGKKGFVIPFDHTSQRFIIFSDQHKGRKDGADDFRQSEPNYLAALEYYNLENFHLISLGDAEELWENTLLQVKKHNTKSFEAEKKFALRSSFTKIFGNHDLDWEIDPLAPVLLKDIYAIELTALEGITLQTTIASKNLSIFCTHGHQGDLQSDGNWLSKFFVAKLWAPLQAYLKINPNTPATNTGLKSLHNNIMYEWSSKQNDLILITGHTHQPVFESLTHFERSQRKQQQGLRQLNPEWAQTLDEQSRWQGVRNEVGSIDYLKIRPSYFNSGCCCYLDGDITGIEIADSCIRLIKWTTKSGTSVRIVLEESALEKVLEKLK